MTPDHRASDVPSNTASAHLAPVELPLADVVVNDVHYVQEAALFWAMRRVEELEAERDKLQENAVTLLGLYDKVKERNEKLRLTLAVIADLLAEDQPTPASLEAYKIARRGGRA